MASRSLGQLTLDLIAKIGGFTGPLDKAGRDLDSKTRAMERRAQSFSKAITGAFGGIARNVGGLLGGFFAVNKAVDGFFASIDRADSMRDLSIQLGIGVENLSALAYAASQTGVDLDTFSTSLLKLEKNMAKALDPKSKQRGLFDALLGKGKADLQDTEKLLSQLSDAFKDMGDSPHQAALEMELFGKSGAKMAEFLKQGSTELDRLTKRARELGVVIDQDAADGADRFNDKLGDVKAVAAGLGTQLATALMPQVEDLLNWMIKFGSDPGNVEKLVKDTTDAFNNLASAISSVGKFGGEIYGVLDTLQGKLLALEQGGQRAAIALYKALSPDGSTFNKMIRENEARLGLLTGDQLHGLAGGPTSRGGPRRTGEPEAAKVDEGAQRRIAAYLGGNTDATNKNAEAKRAAAEAARLQKEREEELARAVKAASEAQEEFQKTLEDLVAQREGPAAESALKYRREEEALKDLWEKSSTPKAEELATALGALHAARDADAEAIRKQLDTGGQHLIQMEEELRLLNLQSDAERAVAQFRLDNPTATDAQAEAFQRLNGQLDETRKQIDAMDEARATFSDFFQDFAKNGISALDTLVDHIQDIILKQLGDKLAESIFGAFGTTGGGGNWLSSIFGSLFGGSSGGGTNFGIPMPGSGALPGYADGTDFHPGGWAVVGEHGRELVNMPRGTQVMSNRDSFGPGRSLNVNQQFVLSRDTSRATQQQIGQRSLEGAQRAFARNS